MSTKTKRYYWLRLQDDFFRSKRIKKLRKMDEGDKMVIIYLKMQLMSLQDDGILTYTGVEESFEEELALDIDEEVEDVKKAVSFLRKHELLEEIDKHTYELPYTKANIGSETDAAARMRKLRAKKRHQPEIEKQEEKTHKTSEGGEKKENIASVVAYKPPTLDEVRKFCKEINSPVNPKTFFDYYEKGHWIDSFGNKVLNWQQKLISWEGYNKKNQKGDERPKSKKNVHNFKERDYDYDALEEKYSRN